MKGETTNERTAAETLEIIYSRRVIGAWRAGGLYTYTRIDGERGSVAEAVGICPRKNNRI